MIGGSMIGGSVTGVSSDWGSIPIGLRSTGSTLGTFADAAGTAPLWISHLASTYAYATMFVLLAVGLYMMIANENLVKKIIGVNLFQTAIFLFFVSVAYVEDGGSPVVPATEDPASGDIVLASPLPHVIVLTAIVVGVALTAVGLALIVRIYGEYGTLREDTLREVRADE